MGIITGTTAAIIGAATIAGGAAVASTAIRAKAEKKAAQKAEEITKTQQKEAKEEQARIEEKYGLTPGELAREGRLFGITEGVPPSRADFEASIRRQEEEFERTHPPIEFKGGQLITPEMTRDAEERKAFTEDIERQRKEFEAALIEPTEAPVGETPAEEAGERILTEPGLEERRQIELERREALTGEELLREVGPETRALLEQVAKRRGMTGEELYREEGGEAARLLAEEVTAPGPTAMFEPELELVRQMVNAEANRRGVFGGLPEGGIRFEQMGRAGVELAIKSARERMAQRETMAEQNIALMREARGEAGEVSKEALGVEETARGELGQYLQDIQSLTAGAKGREAQVGLGAAQTMQPVVASAYTTLRDIEETRGALETPAETGLGALGDIASTYLGKKLPLPAEAEEGLPESYYKEEPSTRIQARRKFLFNRAYS